MGGIDKKYFFPHDGMHRKSAYNMIKILHRTICE